MQNPTREASDDIVPVVPASESLAEVTVKAVLLGALLSAVLAGANAYLGLKVGMTVSASIPAAVVSLAVLKCFRRSNILENNLVQTGASAGEALAAGVIFTMPALVLLGHWDGFPYAPVTALALLGGLLGVGFSIPLRRILLHDPSLRFPEGVATAEVLKSGYEKAQGAGVLLAAGLVAAAVKVAQSGLKILSGSIGGAVTLGGGVFGAGCDLSMALLGVGYIVRLNIAVLVFAGGMIAWLVGIPVFTMIHGPPVDAAGDALAGYDAAFRIWTTKIRYMGVGAMVIGGLWSLFEIFGRVRSGLQRTVTQRRWPSPEDVPRTERDTPNRVIVAGCLLLIVPLVLVYQRVIDPASLQVAPATYWTLILMSVVLAMIGGFVFSAVAGYMAGLVGSSNNPVSGVTIATILVSSLMLSALVGRDAGAVSAAAAAILIGSVVCCAAAISGDNLQDLKAGQLVGATPIRQQFMQVVGVVAGAFTIGPVLNLLYQAYGLGDRMPRAGMDPAEALAAPQATLMQSVAEGVFAGSLEWGMIGIGAAIAAGVIAVDQVLKSRGSTFRAPVLAVAVGIYLPVELTVTLFAGGLISHLASRRASSRGAGETSRGLLLASGLIAGEALAGIALAVPFAATQDTGVLSIAPEGFEFVAGVLGVLVLTGIGVWMYSAGAGKRREGR